jgi:hypothetical protein
MMPVALSYERCNKEKQFSEIGVDLCLESTTWLYGNTLATAMATNSTLPPLQPVHNVCIFAPNFG